MLEPQPSTARAMHVFSVSCKNRRITQQKFKIQAWQESGELQSSAPKTGHRNRG